jgi:xanthosine utilization system XapX-like protein
MKSSPLVVTIVSIIFSIGYGILFSQIYPLVPIDSGIVSLCAILGLTTCLVGIGVWKVGTRIANVRRKDANVYGLISQPIEPGSSRVHTKTADIGSQNPNNNIFVSFSKQDQATALDILGRLEAAGLKCWISCRDVPRGNDYQDAIVDAIDQSGAMILVFSNNANKSEEIKREMALASAKRLFVLPIRIENAEPSKGFKYQLATRQYIDLFEDREKNMTLVVDTLKKHLQSIGN